MLHVASMADSVYFEMKKRCRMVELHYPVTSFSDEKHILADFVPFLYDISSFLCLFSTFLII